jgi:Xaa-Pro aminopeptidase
MMFWNMALLPEGDRPEALRVAQETVCKTDEEREILRQTAAVMVARHEQMFPWLHEPGHG